MQKPFSSHFSSIASQGLPGKVTKNFEKINKKLINKFLRETFTGVLPRKQGLCHSYRNKEEIKIKMTMTIYRMK